MTKIYYRNKTILKKELALEIRDVIEILQDLYVYCIKKVLNITPILESFRRNFKSLKIMFKEKLCIINLILFLYFFAGFSDFRNFKILISHLKRNNCNEFIVLLKLHV